MKAQPNGPVETYLCSYIVDWSNQTARNFRELIAQPMQVFDEKHFLWQNSKTCKHLAALVQDILGTNTVKKVLCLGLGDFCRSAPVCRPDIIGNKATRVILEKFKRQPLLSHSLYTTRKRGNRHDRSPRHNIRRVHYIKCSLVSIRLFLTGL